MQVRVTENGPYRVSGGVPLVRTRPIQSEYGEPVAWAPTEPVEAGETYELCRCGASATKPFCDEVGCTRGFDGTEVADRGPRAARMRVHDGDGVQVTDDRSLCTHVGFCTNRWTHVWEMVRESSDPDVRTEMVAMISRCPSGRLGSRPTGAATDDEPAFPPSVAVVRDGPLWVRGGIELLGADGAAYEIRNRMTLCRCGRSGNKPFCDGTHAEVGFRDPVQERPTGEPAPAGDG